MRSQQEYVLRTVEERAVRFVQLWFTDVLGTPKTFAITPAELENALEEGMTFDGSAIDGFTRVQESDVLARPDPKTFQILPWHPDDGPGGPGLLRHLQPRRHARSRAAPATCCAGPSTAPASGASPSSPPPRSSTSTSPAPTRPHDPVPLDSGSYFELTATDLASDLRKRSVLTLEEMGIPVEHAQHEDAPSQHEIDLRYTDALTMADTVMTVRLVVKEIAQRHGVHASFMPKPLSGVQGSGMHTHLSLFEGDTNAFYDPDDPYGLSSRGQAASSPACCATPRRSPRSPTSGSTPTSAWSRATRLRSTCRGRATTARLWSGCRWSSAASTESTRIEYRAPDSACNPYLAFAVDPGRRAEGHRGGLRPPAARRPPTSSTMTPEELAADGIRPLPGSLDEAVAEMERSELVAETLGEHVFEWFIRNKRAEWAALQDPRSASSSSTATSPASCSRHGTAAVLPRPVPRRAGARPGAGRLPWKAVGPARARRVATSPRTAGRAPWCAPRPTPPGRFALCRPGARPRDVPLRPLLLVVGAAQLSDLELREDLFDDFCVTARPAATRSRPGSRISSGAPGGGCAPELIEHGPLVLNLETYQAAVARAGRSTSPTWSTSCCASWRPGPARCSPARPCSAGCGATSTTAGHAPSTSTSGACGAKLGEEHAHLIETVRSVGYRFGQGAWAP